MIQKYLCREWKLREDIQDNDKEDTISYTLKNRFIFRPDLSKGLTGEEIVTVPHMVILASIFTVKMDRAPMLPLVVRAIKNIFNDPTTPFVKAKAMDFMFNGIGFNCDGHDFASKAVCAAIKSEGEGQGVKVINETFFSVSLLGHVSSAPAAN